MCCISVMMRRISRKAPSSRADDDDDDVAPSPPSPPPPPPPPPSPPAPGVRKDGNRWRRESPFHGLQPLVDLYHPQLVNLQQWYPQEFAQPELVIVAHEIIMAEIGNKEVLQMRQLLQRVLYHLAEGQHAPAAVAGPAVTVPAPAFATATASAAARDGSRPTHGPHARFPFPAGKATPSLGGGPCIGYLEMGESVLSLLWEGHTSELATVYTSLLENNFLVDCTISAGGQSLKAHKLVLCACSPYFQRLFLGETGKHTFLILLDATFETLKAVIDFMYRGETQIPQGSLKAFLTLAQTLEIKGLNNHSKNFTNGNVSSNTIENYPGNPSENNEDIAQVPCVSAISEDNPENSSQLHPHCSGSYQDVMNVNSSLPFEGYSASREEERCSQKYQRPGGCDVDVVVKGEPLHAVISETSNNAWHSIVNSGEHVAGNLTSEMDQRTPIFGAQDLNQHSTWVVLATDKDSSTQF
ncbi:Protein tramtrack, alpha isoform [Gryllus bimaculatus]|nr:Protein tramtrack, alpha isoform [Gryllus bimaculatus]